MDELRKLKDDLIINRDLINDFLRWVDPRSKNTERTYLIDLQQFSYWLRDQGIRFNEITQETIMRFRDDLDKRCKTATLQNYMSAIRQFFQWTELRGLYPNVAKGIKVKRSESKRHKKDYLKNEEVRHLLESIDQSTVLGARDYAMILLMLTTGLRVISISLADIKDVREVGSELRFFYQGKRHFEKDAYVRLIPEVERAIRRYLSMRRDQDPGLFVSCANRNNGERLSTRSISRIVKERLRGAGYDSDRLTAHSLRHTTAMINLRSGGTIEETMQLLDHSDINTTMIYIHEMKREDNQSENRIGRAIFGDDE